MKIGIFGGSFNPIHNGHMNLALSVKDQLGLDRVIIMPSGEAPHKSSSEYAPAEDRLSMCRLAAEEYDGFEVSDYEIRRKGKSYTVYTAEHFKKIFPQDELFLLVGSDMLLSFESWFRYRDILSLVSLAAVSREGNDAQKLYEAAENLSEFGRVFVVKTGAVVISSSEIRNMIKNNGDFTCYLHEKVVKYIMLKKLYT